MESFKILFVLVVLVAFINPIFSAHPKNDDKLNVEEAKKPHGMYPYSHYFGFKKPPSSFLNPKKPPSSFFDHKKSPFYPVTPSGRPRVVATCDKFPRVCHAKGSPGPDCCSKKCVNVKFDSLNCGMCGRKCRYPEICCNGKCVNPLYNRSHCGGCHNKCKRGSFCYYGMCSYA